MLASRQDRFRCDGEPGFFQTFANGRRFGRFARQELSTWEFMQAGERSVRPADADQILALELDDGDRHVMLFGHNPGFSQLAHELARCTFDEMPTCAVARFELDIKAWADAGPGCATLARYGFPKQGAD